MHVVIAFSQAYSYTLFHDTTSRICASPRVTLLSKPVPLNQGVVWVVYRKTDFGYCMFSHGTEYNTFSINSFVYMKE